MSAEATTTTYDFVVIGGGVYGAATAWSLSSAGHRVVVLEAGTVASGASGGPGKRGVRANRRDLRELPLMREAYDVWPRLAERLDADTGYVRTGGLTLIEQEVTGTTGGLIAGQAYADVQTRHGVPTELVDRDRVVELEPEVTDAVRGGLYCPMDGVADHTATTRAFAAAARRCGADVRENAAARRLERFGDRIVAVHTDEASYRVDQAVLILNNAAAADLVRDQLDVSLPVWRMLPQVVFVRPDGTPPVRHLVGHDHRTLSLKALPDGQVMVSGGWRGRWNEAAGRGEAIEANVEGNLRTAGEVYPALAAAARQGADASRPESCSVDGVPIVDVVPGTRNALVGAGWCGHGWAIAPVVADQLATWARTGRRPDLLAPFSLDRFGR